MDAENLKNAEVSFLSYYKYIFSYNILLNGKPIGILMIGGDCDEIYRLEVKAEEKSSDINIPVEALFTLEEIVRVIDVSVETREKLLSYIHN